MSPLGWSAALSARKAREVVALREAAQPSQFLASPHAPRSIDPGFFGTTTARPAVLCCGDRWETTLVLGRRGGARLARAHQCEIRRRPLRRLRGGSDDRRSDCGRASLSRGVPHRCVRRHRTPSRRSRRRSLAAFDREALRLGCLSQSIQTPLSCSLLLTGDQLIGLPLPPPRRSWAYQRHELPRLSPRQAAGATGFRSVSEPFDPFGLATGESTAYGLWASRPARWQALPPAPPPGRRTRRSA